jgi:acid phosphatase
MRDPADRPVRVFLITNRECLRRAGSDDPCPQQADTLANLRALGLDAPTLADDLMLKHEQPEWGSEKDVRRHEVARGYRIVLNVGDDFGDFMPGMRRLSAARRARISCVYRDWWGTRWFQVPNPMYGSWQTVLGPDLEGALALAPPAEDCPEP